MRKIRYTPLILVLALLVNAMLPFITFTPSSHHAGTAPSIVAFGEKILLCTGEGLKWVKLADLQSGKEKPKPHSGDQCPLCSAARHGAKDVLLPIADNLVPPCRVPNVPIHVYAPQLAQLLQTTPLNARAPPSPFIG